MGEQMRMPKAEFSDVDHAADPSAYVECLDYQHAQPFKRTYKERALALLDLAPGQHVPEVGSGPVGALLPRDDLLPHNGTRARIMRARVPLSRIDVCMAGSGKRPNASHRHVSAQAD